MGALVVHVECLKLSVLSFLSNLRTKKKTLNPEESAQKLYHLQCPFGKPNCAMRLLELLLLLPILIQNTVAESTKGSYEQVIITSCQSALDKFKFGCNESHWKCQCTYEPYLGSVTQCINKYLPKYHGSIDRANTYLIERCLWTGVTLTDAKIRRIYQNSTRSVIDSGDVGDQDVLYIPVLPAETDVDIRIRDYRAFLGNFDKSQYYGIIINLFFLSSLVWFGVFNKIKQNRRLNSKLKNDTIDIIRSKFSLPMFLNNHMQPYNYFMGLTSLLPSKAESIVLAIYFTIHTIGLTAGYKLYQDNTIFGPNVYAQLFRYVADRSGILSFAHFPLLVLFAGRNNILISISGLPYSTFMIFHKWTARVMFIDAAIHSVAYLAIVVQNYPLSSLTTEAWLISGLIAFLVALFLVFFAIHNFRVRHYELFLVSHIILALMFFAACYVHCLDFGWLEWVKISAAFWAGDRVVRIYRLFRFGAPVAKIQFISDETFKVQVKRPPNWKPYPGCFVFAHFLHPSIFWQSHPFTIIDSVLNNEEVIIYIKAKEGLTSRVLQILGSRVDNSVNMRVSLEGPYGCQSPVDQFDNVLLITGGNGIPGPFYHALQLVHTPLVPKQRVRLIWVIRRVGALKWFEHELELLKDTGIECDIYITRDFDKVDDEESALLLKFDKFISFHSGRAPVGKILLDEFNNATGTIGIVTCGAPIMCDDVREIVATNLGQCRYRVDLFEELQVW